MDNKQFQEIKNRFSLITKLLAVNLVKDKTSHKDKILALSHFSFTNSQIAEFLGTTSDSVRATVNREKRKAKKKT